MATLLSVPAAIVTFLPRVTVDAAGLIDPANPGSDAFTITNTP
jgi:hypothetical protein